MFSTRKACAYVWFVHVRLLSTGGFQFDLPRAITLAGAAFKAYEEPKPVHCFEDFNVPDTTLLVLDRYRMLPEPSFV